MKRVFIVHGWSGRPEHGWYLWLKRELEKRGFEASVPRLPDTDSPRIEKWIPALADATGKVDEDTFFVGHSLGCQTIARFLESLPENQKAGGVIFVAGFFKHLSDAEYDENEKKTRDHWLNKPINFESVKSKINKSIAFFSKDDPDVPLDNKEDFRTKLGSEIIVLNGYKHFAGDYGINELPIVLEKLLEIAK